MIKLFICNKIGKLLFYYFLYHSILKLYLGLVFTTRLISQIGTFFMTRIQKNRI